MTERSRSLRDSPLVQLSLARLRMFVREPSAVFWTFGFPILLSVALGIAFRNRPPEPVRVGVQAGPGADAVLAAVAGEPQLQAQALDTGGAETALRTGKVSLVVVPGAARTYRYDETRPESRLARLLVDDVLQRAAGRTDPVAVTEQKVTQQGSRYIDFLIPGLLGMNLMASGMWGIGYVVVEMRTRKLLKRMAATPMRRSDFLFSFVVMRLLFLLVELPVLLGFAWLAFGVAIHGSIALVLGLSILGSLAFAGIGLLVAARAQNTQTVGGLMNLVMMPMYVLSGVFFSSANFPEVLQPFIRILPLTALNDALRAVINEGAATAAVLPQIAVLGVCSIASFAVALKLFRWS